MDDDENNAASAVSSGEKSRLDLEGLLTEANRQRERGDYAAALATVRVGQDRADLIDDKTMKASFLYVAGRTYWALADYAKAIELYFEELRLGEGLADRRIMAFAHHGLSISFASMGDGDSALQHNRLALELAGQAGDKILLALVHNSMGNACGTFLKDYKLAKTHHLEALRLREEIGDQRGIADSYTNLGTVALSEGEPLVAVDYLQKAQSVYVQLGLRRYVANTHWRMARVLRGLGRNDEALAEARAALALAETLGSQDVLANIYRELSLTCEAGGDFRQALIYERKFTEADSLARSERVRQRTAELQARYETERQDHEIALLRRDQELKGAEIKRRRFQTLAMGSSLVLGLVILGAIIVVLRTRVSVERRLRIATDAARGRAEAAERLKSRLLLIASHDLKTPLAAVGAMADRIARSPQETERVRQFSANIKVDTMRMGRLVHDFLDAAAIEDGRLDLHRVRTDMLAMTTAAVESLQPLAARKTQSLSVTGAGSVFADIDGGRIRQVLDNLIGNALKFSPAGGTVAVVVGASVPGWVFVEVQDSGPGLKPEDLMRIFKPFQSLSAKPTGGEGSSGLGLFISRELLSLHGGRLEIESLPGTGAIFRFLLPGTEA